MDHFTGHDHDHSHGHDHAHAHAHDHGESEYYIEQLLSIFISGAFGVTGILMYHYNMLQFILAEMFRVPVLVGSIGLLVMTLFRGFCLWKAVGSDHDDEHAHHDHSHDHVGHNHAEGEECCVGEGDSHEAHAHGNIYWRIVVLAFPILIFCMGLPNGTFDKKWIERRLGNESALGSFQGAADKGGAVSSYSFADLNQAAFSAEKREALAGTRASVRGQIRRIPGSQREYSLFYMKKTCCAADIVPLKARIVVDSEPIADAIGSAFKDHEWVEVQGVIQFVEIGKNNFIVVLVVRDANDVNGTKPIYD